MAVGNKKISPTKRRFFKYMSNKPPKDFSELNIEEKPFEELYKDYVEMSMKKTVFFGKL
jgi:hypothetical protein